MAKKSKKKAKKPKKSWTWKMAIAIIVVFVVIAVIVVMSQPDEIDEVYTPPPLDDNGVSIPTISGGPGFTMETALIVDAEDSDTGIAAEYAYLRDAACLGKGGPLEVLGQQLLEDEEGHLYDLLSVRCSDDSTEDYYFQIDSFFGKWQE